MTELLERAIAQLKTLSADEQDAIAARLLTELEDERAWKAQFEATTDAQWDSIAEIVRQEIAAGDITPLTDVFPSKPWSQVLRTHSARNWANFQPRFKSKLAKHTPFGVPIPTITVFSLNELASVKQFTQFALD